MKKILTLCAVMLVALTAAAQGKYEIKSGIAKTVTTVGDTSGAVGGV